LTIALAANPCSSTITSDNISTLVTTKVDNRLAEGATAPSVHTVESSLATATSPDYLPIESAAPAPPMAVEMSSTKKALHDAKDTMKTMNLYDAWDTAIRRINWVMNTVSPVAEVYPFSFFVYP